jgi:hypothetical protein
LIPPAVVHAVSGRLAGFVDEVTHGLAFGLPLDARILEIPGELVPQCGVRK